MQLYNGFIYLKKKLIKMNARQLITFCLNLFVCFTVTGQSQDYFQQEVNYKIDVRLDDQNHVLHGFEEISYTNNSPDELPFLYFHLWPNAYKNRKTAFNRQKVRTGSDRFHYAGDDQRGFIDSLDFVVDGISLPYSEVNDHPDIAKVSLEEPLKPGQTVTITTPFRVKLPASFSRLGHVNQQYQITQWYPKPAVYDKNGWHPMPYLDMGEFYSEFGSFEVSITVPSNYVVGATGNLQNPEEIKYLDSLSEVTANRSDIPSRSEDDFPPSSDSWKTLTYTQSNVHDFAWFADKRYAVRTGEVMLPGSGRRVKLIALYNKSNGRVWEDIIEYMHDGVFYYSKWIGDYPYDVVTVVDGALSAGAGMEYPTITVLGGDNKFALEQVTVHEIGHNWFYGILGSNERVYPWMDEGLNSYYELRYFRKKYPEALLFGLDQENTDGVPFKLAKFFGITEVQQSEYYNEAYQALARYNADQPNSTHSDSMTAINYGIISYQKTAAQLDYLQYYLGQEKFDSCMNEYFQKWLFRHPQPEDLQMVFEQVSGKDLNWFFGDFLKTKKKLDYKITKVSASKDQTTVRVKNNGQIDGPVRVDLLADGESESGIWVDGFQGTKEIVLPSSDADEAVLFHGINAPDTWDDNNNRQISGLFPGQEPFRLKFLGEYENPTTNSVYWLPAIAANTTDKLMLGGLFYNTTIPNKKFKFIFNPMFSFGRDGHAGFYKMGYEWLPTKGFLSIEVSAEYRDFAGMTKFSPQLRMVLKPNNLAWGPKQILTLNHSEMTAEQDILPMYEDNYQIGRAQYNIFNNNALYRAEAEVLLTTNYDNFSNIQVRGDYERDYMRGKTFRLSGYLGGFLQADNVAEIYQLNFSGSPDYTMDHIFLDRAGVSRNMRSLLDQNDLQQGAMRGFVAGNTDGWLATVNADIGTPFSNNLRLYFDTGFDLSASETVYSTGLSYSVANMLFFYFPLAGDSYLDSVPEDFADFTRNIRFSIRFSGFNPWNRIESALRF